MRFGIDIFNGWGKVVACFVVVANIRPNDK
jgi:hypothetical protein